MGFFDWLFGGKAEPEVRPPLEHPKDLCLGDIIKFNFLDQDDLTGKRFEIVDVNTYDFRDGASTSFTLRGEDASSLFLSYSFNDGDEKILIGKKLTRSDVNTIFGPDEFAEVFDEGHVPALKTKIIPPQFENWIGKFYSETYDCLQGYYLSGDYRNKSLPSSSNVGDALDYYMLEDDKEKYAVEIEVYSDGTTDITAIVYLPLNAIEDMYPKG